MKPKGALEKTGDSEAPAPASPWTAPPVEGLLVFTKW